MDRINKLIEKIENTSFHLSLKGYKREEVDLLLSEIVTNLKNQIIEINTINFKIKEYSKQLEQALAEKEEFKYELERLKSELRRDE
ncbi:MULTISPECIES: DivIVA domain-containing protein [unclassified Mycoplasma]|uniref:DivIVA domain-containing protein n=1 Tax=unclassified Mycoplasma TaxID=2683645 RepID=UPI00211CA7C4|nr:MULTISPECIES: DivIVA domain-containing protein [unclassified Mycoplasma]UUM19826.1 DivIVA domain-containing protein [Mycoplasma sp. 1578d]UUM24810.1 DivIVA domain-containing protein [Mycoplasma sp. 3686d]